MIGSGIDIVSTKRLNNIISRRPGVEKRLFTPTEIEYCRSKKNYIQSMAGRVAAKEAVYKVINKYIDGLYFKDIEIINNKQIPCISSECRAAQYIKQNNLDYSISISHDQDYAVAQAIFWRKK